MTTPRSARRITVLCIGTFASICFRVEAQPLTLTSAVDLSLRNYPAIQVSQEQLNAAAAGIRLARTAYLPRIDAIAQVNEGTRNNIYGPLLPQSVIPSISGPVLGTSFGTTFGSAVGALVSWEPFDFGLRRSNVETAEAARAQSERTLQRTRFEVAVAAADAFLTLTAAQQSVLAARAGVDRAESVSKIISALVGAELRPGADASRSEAETAAARTQSIQAEQAVEIARANLARFTGLPPAQIAIAPARLLELPPEREAAALNVDTNPIAAEQAATVEQARAQLRALERSYFPRFSFQGAAYSRGSGAEANGKFQEGANGLAPTTGNYTIGFTVTFPVMDRASIQARESAQSSTIKAQAARSRQIAADLQAQWNAAVATVNGARRVAANLPKQVEAAQAASRQATARYQAGLGNIAEVAEAQRLLTQTEIDFSLARLNVWRGLLAVAAAAGDLTPFLAEVGQ